MTTKLLTVIIPTFNQSADLRQLLLQLTQQAAALAPNGDPEIEILVQDDRSRDDVADVCGEFAGVRLVCNTFRRGSTQQLVHAYAYADAEYVWVIQPTDRLSGDALRDVVNELQHNKPEVLLLNRMRMKDDDIDCANVLGMLPYVKLDHPSISGAVTLAGMYGALALVSGVVCRAGCPSQYWPEMLMRSPQVYMLLRRFHSSRIRILGAPHIEHHIDREPKLVGELTGQYLHTVCSAVIDNLSDGVDWLELIQTSTERHPLPHAHNFRIFDALQASMDALWKIRHPLRGDTLLAYYRICRAINRDMGHMLHVNRAAELCPGCSDLFEPDIRREGPWMPDLRRKIFKCVAIGDEFELVQHPALDAHPFGWSFGLRDTPTLELTQREWDSFEVELQTTVITRGLEIGTQLGFSAAVAAKRIAACDPNGGELTSLTTKAMSPAVPSTAPIVRAGLAQLFGVESTARWNEQIYEGLDGILKYLTNHNKKKRAAFDYVFINEQRTPDELLKIMQHLKPVLAPAAVVFLRTLDREERINRFALDVLGTTFSLVPLCQQPYGYGLAKAVLPSLVKTA